MKTTRDSFPLDTKGFSKRSLGDLMKITKNIFPLATKGFSKRSPGDPYGNHKRMHFRLLSKGFQKVSTETQKVSVETFWNFW